MFVSTTASHAKFPQPLVSYFVNGNHHAEVNTQSPLKGQLCMTFANLVRDMYDAKEGGVISPVQFFRQLQVLAPHLMDHQQQDAQEFLRFLLDGLCEDLCRRRKPPDRMRMRHLHGSTRENAKGPTRDAPSHPALDKVGAFGSASRIETRDRQSRRGSLKIVSAEAEESSHRMPVMSRSDLTALRKHRFSGVEGEAPEPSIASKSSPKGPEVDSESETSQTVPVMRQAQSSWEGYMRLNDSIVADLFAGQLQSTVTCLTCNARWVFHVPHTFDDQVTSRSYCFDPFLDLSVPIPSMKGTEPRSGFTPARLRSRISQAMGSENVRCSLEECLANFTAEEVLEGDDMTECGSCKAKTRGTKKLSVFCFPRILVKFRDLSYFLTVAYLFLGHSY